MRRSTMWFFGRPAQLTFWVAVVVVGWLVFGPGVARARWWWPFERPSPVASSMGSSSAPVGWTAVAKATMPGVVNVASSRIEQGRPGSADPLFQFFFGPESGPRRERGLGSGVMITADGYVLTNNHVVEGARDIRVTLPGHGELTAKVVGADPKTDLAVLKVPGSGFPVVPFGDSSRVEVAEVVLAIGSPFGLTQTVTMGIVSAVGRANVGIADYEDFIQTDAAINPGNSGGALVNVRGELIGINTAIFSQTGGYMGIGFAVPANMARSVMDQLVKRGRLTRGYLGVAVQELTPTLARGLELPATRGILVGDVMPDSPAAKAGLRRGDVIVAIGGKPVEDTGHFRNLVAGTAPGTRVQLTILRAGKEQTVELEVGDLPERTAAAAAAPGGPDPLGLSVIDMTPEMARRLDLPASQTGVVVTGVLPGGLAAEAGLRPGDLIQEVNRRPVRSSKEFARAVEQAGGRDLVLLVNRRGSTAYAVIGRSG